MRAWPLKYVFEWTSFAREEVRWAPTSGATYAACATYVAYVGGVRVRCARSVRSVRIPGGDRGPPDHILAMTHGYIQVLQRWRQSHLARDVRTMKCPQGVDLPLQRPIWHSRPQGGQLCPAWPAGGPAGAGPIWGVAAEGLPNHTYIGHFIQAYVHVRTPTSRSSSARPRPRRRRPRHARARMACRTWEVRRRG